MADAVWTRPAAPSSHELDRIETHMTDQTLEQRISECGRAMAMAAVPIYTLNGSIHPPTLVAACGRMSGYYLLQSFGVVTTAMKPGETILSPQAAEKTPVLLRTCAAILASLGHSLPPDPPQPFVDETNTPREDFLQSQGRLVPVFAPLLVKFGLDHYNAARAAAVATAITVHTVTKHIELTRGFGAAAFAFTEGSRTVPAHDAGAENAV